MNRMPQEPAAVRLVFELARADNPRLYDELVRFPKGARRVNRLRVLAYDGLLAQNGVFAAGSSAHKPAPVPVAEGSAAPGLTVGIFEPALDE